jgi:hypothetical protein
MATIQKGTVSTTEVLQDSLAIDMRSEISMADADETQFTTFTMNAKHGEASREKVNWREKDYFPRLVTVNGALASGGTALIVSTGQGPRLRRGDVLRSMPMGDAAFVESVSGDTATITRSIGAKTAQAWSVGDTLLIMSNASPQGADFPDTAVLTATLGFNYTQIFRHGLTFSRTAWAVDYIGQSEPSAEEGLKGIEHKRAIEYSGFWGARDLKTDLTTGEPLGFAGGLTEFIVTNRQDVAGSLTVDYLDNFLRTALQRTSKPVMYVAPLVAQQISKFNRGGQGTAWRAEPANVAGLKVDAFMSGVYGTEVPVVVKKDWNDFPSTLKQFGGWLFICDMDKIEFKPLRGGSTKLLTNRQHPGGDRKSEEWLTEATWEVRNEKSHSILFGIT